MDNYPMIQCIFLQNDKYSVDNMQMISSEWQFSVDRMLHNQIIDPRAVYLCCLAFSGRFFSEPTLLKTDDFKYEDNK